MSSTTFYTAIINDEASPHFVGVANWAIAVLRHNQQWLGPARVVTERSSRYLAMLGAATAVYGPDVRYNWGFGTMGNYVAMLEFLNSSDAELLWIEADMVINPSIPLVSRYGVCATQAWNNPDYTPTPYEQHKRAFCEAFIPSPVRPYKHLMSSWLRLDRATVTNIVASLRDVGLDLCKKEAWLKIQAVEHQIAVYDFRFVCDMVLELSWMVGDWTADNVFDMLGWVSYHDNYETKPIMHFDSGNKAFAADWVNKYGKD